uniref:SFRICE_001819 n=1 Tax=Spodoptera frugiperda TaxID=7108 RepID=A0A2H1V5N7_SPOFR
MPMMPMPMPFGYGPMMMPAPPPPPPMSVAVPVPVGIPIPYPETTTTTTTTTTASSRGEGNQPDGIPIAIPVPVPHFVQIAIPGFMPPNCAPKDRKPENGNKNCPPCPPCSCNPCTPSFFAYCSPCHLQCRCKNGQENPRPQPPIAPLPLPGPAFPMPIPMPAPPPVVIVPFPPQFETPRQDSPDCSQTVSASSSTEDSESCESDQSRRRRRRKKDRGKNRRKSKYDIYRRSFGGIPNNERLVKPVLTYMSRDGEIKMKRRLSNDEATALLSDDSYQHVQLIAGDDSDNRPRVVVRSQSQPYMRSNHRRQQLMLQDGSMQHSLGDGKKELVFRPPENKKISNLSVSFQITK